jgi:hypothetical protein
LAEIEMEQPAAGRYAEVAESEASLERFETWLTATGDVSTSKPRVVRSHAERRSVAVRCWQRLRGARVDLHSHWFLSVSALCLRT